jgi:ketosteroid isomerase-like protein
MRQNLALVRSMYAAWARGDFSSVAWAHPDIEFVIGDGPSPGTWSGLAGMAEGEREFLRGWEEFRAEPDEYREVDDERVLVLVAAAGRGKTSGLDLEQMRTAYPSSRGGASLIQVRDGKVTKVVLYTTATVSSPTSGSPRRTTSGSRRVARERRSGAPGRRGLA